MKALLLLLALLSASHAMAQAYTIDLKVVDKIEAQAVNEASQEEIKALVECVVEAGKTRLEDTACINDVLGDVHN